MTLKEIIKSINKKEWHFVILLIVVMILITTLPYIYAYLNAPTGYFYNGIHSLTPGDSAVYFSYINQVKSGAWLLKDNFTSEIQTTGLLNLFWLKVGLFARLFNLSAPLSFQLARIFLLAVFLTLIYIFISYFFKEEKKRKISLLFICFSSGIGAYFAPIIDKLYPFNADAHVYFWPPDLWVPESNIFLTLYQTPHFIASLTLMVAFFFLMLLAWENNKYFYSLIAGLLGLIWFNFHPFYFPYMVIILFFYALSLFVKTPRLRIFYHYALAIILSSPFVFYHYYEIKTVFAVGARASQNVLISPPFIFVFLGFGFLLIFSFLAIIFLAQKKILLKNDKYVFLTVWLIIGLFLVYSPIFFQIRFLQGLEIPMVLLTVIFIFNFLFKSEKFLFLKNNIFLQLILFVILFCFSTVFNLSRDITYFQLQKSQFYLPNEFKTATTWLANNNIQNKAILSYEYTGQLIPAFINQQVYLAHHIETLFYQDKKNKVDDFFADKYNEVQANEFLKQNNIGYLFFTDLEKTAGRYQPQDKDYLNKIFDQGEIQIYEFID